MKNRSHFLIIGLGNPGVQYTFTRHNAGFLFLDQIALHYGVSFKEKNNYELSLFENSEYKIYFLKPMMFMNLSGIPVLHVASYYKIKPENIIIAYDDVDLPLGKIRLRSQGSAGGHNGIKSILQNLGKDNFIRLRLGVGPRSHEIPLDQYVLSAFSKSENQSLEDMLLLAKEACLKIISSGVAVAMNTYNGTEKH